MLIVGLGNPGSKYENTYHNMGFSVVDKLVECLGIKLKDKQCDAVCGSFFTGGEKIVIAKPQTYMNLSGVSVKQLLAYHKMKPQDLIVVYDDIDLPIGNLRIRKEGSAGTHNGMRNIVSEISSTSFARIRVGVGHDLHGAQLRDMVLARVDAEYKECVDNAINNACKALLGYIKDRDFDAMMRNYNSSKKK